MKRLRPKYSGLRKSMKTPIARVIALVIAFLLVCSVTTTLAVDSYDFQHYEGFEKGLEAGKAANKLVLLDFYFDT